MSKSRVLIAAALLLALAGTAAFAAGGKEKSAEPAIYLITMDQMDQHWVTVDAGCRKAVAELGGIRYRWMAPDVKDDAKQIDMINNAVAGGAKAILLAANGPTAVTSALREAAAAGVKIVYVDSAADFPAYQTLATDNKAAGFTAGKEMLKALTAAGLSSGKIGIVNVNAATASVVNREKGFREAFAGTGFSILETQYSDGDAARSKDIAANYITLGCVGIFGANEGSTVGIGNAIQETGKKVVGVGFDKSDMILSLIRNGHLLATMAQNPDVMGYEGVKSAMRVLKGEPAASPYIDTGVSVITKASLK